MRESALVEPKLPIRDGGNRRTLRAAHRACTHAAIVREIPEWRDGQFRRCLRTLVLRERTNHEIAILHAPHQGWLRKDKPIQLRGLVLGIFIEHLPPLRRCPPHDHAIAFREDAFGQYLGVRASTQGTHQGFHKRHSERLCGTKRRWGVLLNGYVVAGDKALLTVSIDQKSFTQLEAMILPDRDVYLHGCPPTFPTLATLLPIGRVHG